MFYDPDGVTYGIPTFPFKMAPAGLATARQLRADGLRPGGQQIAAQLMWWHSGGQVRVAYLYRRDLALPKRTASPGQQAAIAKALLARRTCPDCRQVRNHYIPRRTGVCLDCPGPAKTETTTEELDLCA